jgi:hypothetical protein
MPGLLCTVCIGNYSPAALESVDNTVGEPADEPADGPADELVDELVDEPADQPVDEHADEFPDELARVVNRRAKSDHQTYRRWTWNGNTQDDAVRGKAQDKRLSAGNESSTVTEVADRPSISNDYNFWQDERFPIVQTWKEKAKTMPARQDCAQVDLPSPHHLAQRNIREQSETDLLLAEEYVQGESGEQLKLEMKMRTEQHVQAALSLFEFAFEWDESEKNMLVRQENPETPLLLPEHPAQALVADCPEMELPLAAHVAHALSV